MEPGTSDLSRDSTKLSGTSIRTKPARKSFFLFLSLDISNLYRVNKHKKPFILMRMRVGGVWKFHPTHPSFGCGMIVMGRVKCLSDTHLAAQSGKFAPKKKAPFSKACVDFWLKLPGRSVWDRSYQKLLWGDTTTPPEPGHFGF
jgi:hypothetical protein